MEDAELRARKAAWVMTRRLTAVSLALLAAPLVYGEIEKIGTPCEQGICLSWWPKLPAVGGWHHERDASLQYGANALAPDGFSFSNAEVVMYAAALYKPRMPATKSVDTLIADDKKKFLAQDPSILVSEVSSITTADGQRMRSFSFFPKAKGNWERVSYGEEDDFFLVFTISSRSLEAYKLRQADYEALVARYRTKPADAAAPSVKR
jgi:hypothetical protein